MAGADLESLLRGVEAIYADLAEPGPDDEPLPADIDDCGHPLDPEAEAQVEAVLRTLWRIGRAARRNAILVPPTNALGGALGGANLLMRSDLIVGPAPRIAARLPAFVYLTTLIFLDRPEAERRSLEVEALVEAEGFGDTD